MLQVAAKLINRPLKHDGMCEVVRSDEGSLNAKQ